MTVDPVTDTFLSALKIYLKLKKKKNILKEEAKPFALATVEHAQLFF